MVIEQQITGAIIAGIKELYGADVTASQVQLQNEKRIQGALDPSRIPIPSHVEEISGADRSGNR